MYPSWPSVSLSPDVCDVHSQTDDPWRNVGFPTKTFLGWPKTDSALAEGWYHFTSIGAPVLALVGPMTKCHSLVDAPLFHSAGSRTAFLSIYFICRNQMLSVKASFCIVQVTYQHYHYRYNVCHRGVEQRHHNIFPSNLNLCHFHTHNLWWVLDGCDD